jgi:hypothetical protein
MVKQNSVKTPTKTKLTPISELAKNMTTLQRALVDLVKKQNLLMEKLDRFVNKVIANEERLKRLEDNSLNHVESATWVKASLKFCPLIIACLLLGHQMHALLLNYRLH